MAPRKANHPTDAELEILRVLWRDGPRTVREVHAELSASRDVGYTSVLKVMQLMVDKRLLARDESQRTHVYRAAKKQTDTQRQLVKVLADKAFGGATEELVLQAISARKLKAGEIAKIRELLDSLDG